MPEEWMPPGLTLPPRDLTSSRMSGPTAEPTKQGSSASISLRRLQALGDSICVRDARGRSRSPALLPRGRPGGDGHLEIRGSFAILQRFSVSPQEGRTFVEASRDANPIHTEDSVISGAMSAARVLLLPEILIPGLAVKTVRIKFRAFARYDRPSVNRYLFRPGSDGSFQVDLVLLQQGAVVADGSLTACVAEGSCPAIPHTIPRIATNQGQVIRDFFRSLRVDPDLSLEAIGLGYPRAFLAALPSGEMVRRGGSGGLLNVLDLEFPDVEIPAFTDEPPPSVEVESTRPKSAFRKVLARVGNGIVTYCQGYATVLASMLRSSAHEAAPTGA